MSLNYTSSTLKQIAGGVPLLGPNAWNQTTVKVRN